MCVPNYIDIIIIIILMQRELVVKHLPEHHLLEPIELLLFDVRTAPEFISTPKVSI